jgi:hypothetical protein
MDKRRPLQAFWPFVVAPIAVIEVFSIFAFNSPFGGGEIWSIRADFDSGDVGFGPARIERCHITHRSRRDLPLSPARGSCCALSVWADPLRLRPESPEEFKEMCVPALSTRASLCRLACRLAPRRRRRCRRLVLRICRCPVLTSTFVAQNARATPPIRRAQADEGVE